MTLKSQTRPDANVELVSTEELLGTEVDRLQHYNRLLERGMPNWLTTLVTGFRDEQVKRLQTIQAHIRSCHASLEARP